MPRKEEYQRNKEYLREYNKRYLRAWYAKNPDKKRKTDKNLSKYMKDYLEDPTNRKKYLARQTLNNRIREGAIKRGVCEMRKCRLTGHGHHDDYNKPLEVRWLCRQHHEDLHHNMLNE